MAYYVNIHEAARFTAHKNTVLQDITIYSGHMSCTSATQHEGKMHI